MPTRARRTGASLLAVTVTRPAGRFRFALPLRKTPAGRYRVVVQAQTPSGRPLGRPVRLSVRITGPTVRRSPPPRRLAQQAGGPEVPAGAAVTEPAPPPPTAPGVGRAGPAVVPVTLAEIVNGQDIDLSGVLGEFQLPAQLGTLEPAQLEDRVCRGVAVICLGLDRPLVNEQLKDLVNRNLVGLALRNLTSGELEGLLTQLTTLLDQGDLSQLISVQRVDDRVLRLAPAGPLAQISGLPDVPDLVVGRLQVVGVLRCPPATVGGLPRVCVA
jgi:hypothetical protein